MTGFDSEIVRSTHKVEVVPVRLEKHPHADKLAIVQVFGYSVCTALDDWLKLPAMDAAGTRLGAYIPPDSLVDTRRPEFTFLAKDAKLDGKARIRAKKLRGVVSFGLLVPAPEGATLGDDVATRLGVEHYEPLSVGEANGKNRLFMGGEVAPPPVLPFTLSKYDIDAFRRYAQVVFVPGEPVIVTEKIHGSNARYVYVDGQMHCGSRDEWKKEFPTYAHVTEDKLIAAGKSPDEAAEIVRRLKLKTQHKNLWWLVLETCPALRTFCESNPGVVVYGEVFGQQKHFHYGTKPGVPGFAAFDVKKDGQWVNYQEACDLLDKYAVPRVPPLRRGGCAEEVVHPYDFDQLCALADGMSLWPGALHLREGIVVKPLQERWCPLIGRVQLKVVSADYLALG